MDANHSHAIGLHLAYRRFLRPSAREIDWQEGPWRCPLGHMPSSYADVRRGRLDSLKKNQIRLTYWKWNFYLDIRRQTAASTFAGARVLVMPSLTSLTASSKARYSSSSSFRLSSSSLSGLPVYFLRWRFLEGGEMCESGIK
jgi:hypothetical protein